MVSLLIRRQKDRNELVAVFPDLAPHLLEADVMAELYHGFMPGKRVEIDRAEVRCRRGQKWQLWAQGTPSLASYDFPYQAE